MENVVAQMLTAAGQELHYHQTPTTLPKCERMEIDFLLTKTAVTSRHNVIPVEVKSSKDYTTVSLERFKTRYPACLATAYVLHPGNIKQSNGITYLPLYIDSAIGHSKCPQGR